MQDRISNALKEAGSYIQPEAITLGACFCSFAIQDGDRDEWTEARLRDYADRRIAAGYRIAHGMGRAFDIAAAD